MNRTNQITKWQQSNSTITTIFRWRAGEHKLDAWGPINDEFLKFPL
jgi:hypothetical protein